MQAPPSMTTYRDPNGDWLDREVTELLASEPSGGFHCEHEDLGYGFGAWSNEFLRLLGERDLISLGWPPDVGGGGVRPETSTGSCNCSRMAGPPPRHCCTPLPLATASTPSAGPS